MPWPYGIAAMGKKINGPFAALPYEVMDSPAYRNVGPTASLLLNILLRQSTGRNNGQLQAAFSFCMPRGIKSKNTLAVAIEKLIKHGLIFRTRGHGFSEGKNICARYAITFLPLGDKEHLRGLFLDGFKANAWKDWKP